MMATRRAGSSRKRVKAAPSCRLVTPSIAFALGGSRTTSNIGPSHTVRTGSSCIGSLPYADDCLGGGRSTSGRPDHERIDFELDQSMPFLAHQALHAEH